MRRDHNRVGLAQVFLERAGRERARVVRGIAPNGAARVDDHRLASADLTAGRATVRTRGVRSGRDDRLEGDPLGTFVVEELLDRPRDVALGAADEALLDQPFEDTVGDLACLLQRGQLALVLHGSERLDQAAARNRLDRPTAQGLVAAEGDEVGLETDRTGEPFREILQQCAFRLLEANPLHSARCLGIPEVAEQAHVVRLHQESSIRALEADEIEDVDRVGDEQWFRERLL